MSIIISLEQLNQARPTRWRDSPWTPHVLHKRGSQPWLHIQIPWKTFQKYLDTQIYSSSIIYNSQKVKANHVSTDGWMDK